MPSRAEATAREKGEYVSYLTVNELARLLNVAPLTINRWERAGKIPQHDVRTEHGWRLWSPVHAREILQKKARL